MIYEVPRDYAICLLLVSAPLGTLLATISGKSIFFLVGFLVFGIGWIIGALFARNDPEFFTVLLTKLTIIRATKEGGKGNEYIP